MSNTDSPLDECLEKGLIDCYKAGVDHGMLTGEYGVGVVLEKREFPVKLAKTELKQAISLYCHKQVIEARIDELNNLVSEGGFWCVKDYEIAKNRIAELKGVENG